MEKKNCHPLFEIIALLLLFVHLSSGENICPYAETVCECKFRFSPVVKCFNYEGTKLPPLQVNYTHVDEVYIGISYGYHNELRVISGDDLPSGLKRFTMYADKLKAIGDDLFKNSESTLKEVTISSDSIRAVPGALRNLTSLEDFYIAGSNLTEWDEDILQQLGKTVKFLGVDWAANFKMEYLRHFQKLEELHIHATVVNKGSPFPTNVTATVKDLEIGVGPNLDAKYAKYEPADTIGPFSSLESLNILGTKLGDVSDYGAYLPGTAQTLKTILIARSQISYTVDLSGLEALSYFECQVCKLERFPKFKIHSLITLNLYGTDIKSIEKDSLLGLESLQELELRRNKISFIDHEAFSGLSSLTRLVLDSNRLSVIPAALTKLPKLQELRLVPNPLECPCTPKALHDWFVKTIKDNHLDLGSFNPDCAGTNVKVKDTLTDPRFVCNDGDVLG